MLIQQEIIEDAKLKANKEARKIVIQTIQRTAAEQAIENAITVFNLESDEIKGSIIGREGRNIRAIEAATGVDLIVDDTPEAIVLSSFDPLRREIARFSCSDLWQMAVFILHVLKKWWKKQINKLMTRYGNWRTHRNGVGCSWTS